MRKSFFERQRNVQLIIEKRNFEEDWNSVYSVSQNFLKCDFKLNQF